MEHSECVSPSERTPSGQPPRPPRRRWRADPGGAQDETVRLESDGVVATDPQPPAPEPGAPAAGGPGEVRAARLRVRGGGEEPTRRAGAEDEEATRRIAAEDDVTRRMGAEDDATRRIAADDDEATRRIGERPRGGPGPGAGDDDEATWRMANRDDDDATRRLADQLPPAPAGPLVLDRYRLEHRLGAGGFGVVWQARDERLERDVAVKVLPRHDAGAQEPARRRAEREAFAAARLNHPGIVAVYELAEDDESRYLVSELVRGTTLADLSGRGALSDRDVARIGTALCDALAHAHAHDVVHRDVKPQNVLIPDRPADGAAVAKLTDFGIALLADADALTRTGDVVGTLAYMAPEQAEGRRATAASDLYSLGVVLYEALAGRHPVRRAGAAATARRIGAAAPPLQRERRDLQEELCAAIDRAVSPRPADRGDLHDLRAALADALPELGDEGRTIAGSPVEGLVPMGLPRHAPRLAAGLAAGILVWAGVGELVPDPPAAPPALAAGAAVLVALLPRIGWGLAAAALVGWLAFAPDGRPGTAVVLALALVACPLLLLRSGRAWSLPAAAPALGALGLAGAYPALAGQARSGWARLALGAVGFWWLALAEPLLGLDLFFGRSPGTEPLGLWSASAADAFDGAVEPLLASGALAGAAVWAGFALILPWVVRGRWGAVDVVAASAWAAGLASASGAVGQALDGTVARSDPRGAIAGAVLGAVVAVVARALRPAPPAHPTA